MIIIPESIRCFAQYGHEDTKVAVRLSIVQGLIVSEPRMPQPLILESQSLSTHLSADQHIGARAYELNHSRSDSLCGHIAKATRSWYKGCASSETLVYAKESMWFMPLLYDTAC